MSVSPLRGLMLFYKRSTAVGLWRIRCIGMYFWWLACIKNGRRMEWNKYFFGVFLRGLNVDDAHFVRRRICERCS